MYNDNGGTVIKLKNVQLLKSAIAAISRAKTTEIPDSLTQHLYGKSANTIYPSHKLQVQNR